MVGLTKGVKTIGCRDKFQHTSLALHALRAEPVTGMLS